LDEPAVHEHRFHRGTLRSIGRVRVAAFDKIKLVK
jgi:hypothetical protein